MKFCPTHWEALRAAISARGLDHLVAANGREAFARTVDQLRNPGDQSNFDPLLEAHWMIMHRVTEYLGLWLLTGDYCPLCEVIAAVPAMPEGTRYKTAESYFIDGPADAVLARCREDGTDKPFPGPPL